MSRKTAVNKEYRFRNHQKSTPDAQRIGSALDDVRAASGDGKLYPAHVVEYAEPDVSPLHNDFEWDNDAAAHQFRLGQARNLIASVVVVYSDGKQSSIIPAYYHIGTEDECGYRPANEVMSSEELYKKLLVEACSQLGGIARRYSHMPEMRPVLDAIESVKGEVGALT